MQRVDGAYLYEFGRSMRALSDLAEVQCTRWSVHFALAPAHSSLYGMVYQSVFRESWKVVHLSAANLLQEIHPHLVDFEKPETFEEELAPWNIIRIKEAFRSLEAVMKAELQSLSLYYPSPKGGFENKTLVDNGIQIFPQTLPSRAPEAVKDAIIGARCMGFELWTAMAFHLHRSNEAVLRRYYNSVIGSAKKPRHLTMGTMIFSMEKNDVGDANIRSALNNITVFHRNPIAHPDHHIESGEEALSLYAAIRAAMGYMLDKLPDQGSFAIPAVLPEVQSVL